MKQLESRPSLRFTTAWQPSLSAALQAKAGAEGDRTPDLLNAIEALYQLSYDPVNELQTLDFRSWIATTGRRSKSWRGPQDRQSRFAREAVCGALRPR